MLLIRDEFKPLSSQNHNNDQSILPNIASQTSIFSVDSLIFRTQQIIHLYTTINLKNTQQQQNVRL